ncbi:MAG: regulatory protein RecX [Deltaproteobacteria bacterium]|nr:regulatory protein RecX [Deltaproteobacteria bacterium]
MCKGKTKDKDLASARAYALKMLSYRDRSACELTDKVISKGYEPLIAKEVVSRLKDENYLDDEAYAVELAGFRNRNKLWGTVKIAAELRSKGITREVISKITSSLGSELEENAAKKALQKWLKKSGLSKPIEQKNQKGRDNIQRAMRHLKTKGFPLAVIRKVIDEFNDHEYTPL